MDEPTRLLLFQVAAFLRCLVDRVPIANAHQEATMLLNKVGGALASDEAAKVLAHSDE